MRLAFALLTALFALQDSGRREEVLGRIESFPEDLLGEWVVAGESYTADGNTEFDLDFAPAQGVFAKVEFVLRDGVRVALEIEPQRAIDPAGLVDGPYVFWTGERSFEVRGVCQGRAVGQKGVLESVLELEPFCLADGPSSFLEANPPRLSEDTFPMPEVLLAVSDIEGNYEALGRFLVGNGVVGEDLRWTFGRGHLVFVGDIVDRGEQVTETLWLIHRLQFEARRAGGAVHFVLGNHEVMIAGGDTRYVHDRYLYTTYSMGLDYEELFGPDTEFGRWFRRSPSVLRIGEFLFVHGGLSPTFLERRPPLHRVNEAIAFSVGRPRESLDPELEWLLSSDGPLWYRGYHRESERPRPEVLARLLAAYDARHVVVGHTVVPEVKFVDAERAVIGIDVAWKEAGSEEGLRIEGGQLFAVDARGERRSLGPVGGR